MSAQEKVLRKAAGNRALNRGAPIGVFDSGLGGLTVVQAIRRALPNEDVVYLGDTARVPYGTRSKDTVIRYAQGCANALLHHEPKVLVVACNTVSAVALPTLRVDLDIPVLGVIEPGARAGVSASHTGRLAVLATEGTVASGAYERAVSMVDSRAELSSVPASLLVSLAEEGWTEGQVPELVVERYLGRLVGKEIDAIILGCTHFPLFRGVIERVAERLFERDVIVADSAEAAAENLRTLLTDRDLLTKSTSMGTLCVEVTDLPARFHTVAARFLGDSLDDVSQIDL